MSEIVVEKVRWCEKEREKDLEVRKETVGESDPIDGVTVSVSERDPEGSAERE